MSEACKWTDDNRRSMCAGGLESQVSAVYTTKKMTNVK